MSIRFWGVVVIGVMVTAACFSPSFDRPTCGPAGLCPSGMICDSDGTCESLPDTCRSFDLKCPAGQICAAHQAVCIDIGSCGDGIVEPGEVCDDGNLIDLDGCSHDCQSTEVCGNEIVDLGEECDLGGDNGSPISTCDSDCRKVNPLCGNAMVDPDAGEQCDPGPTDSAACNSKGAGAAACRPATCGDGYTNMAAKEVCDTSGVDQVMCNGRLCTTPVCGDNYVNLAAGEQCESGGEDTQSCNGLGAGSAACHAPSCGDGYVNRLFKVAGASNEQCDNLGGGDTENCNGNNGGNNGPGSCRFPLCGDGYVNTQFKPDGVHGEQCDPPGGVDTPTCNGGNASNGAVRCQPAICGDGYRNVAAGEDCDRGAQDTSSCNGANAGTASCRPAICGDGYVNRVRGEDCEQDTDCPGGQTCKSCLCG